MIDRFNFNVSVSGKGKDKGGPGREIWNFEDLRRRVQAMAWDESVKKVFLKRIAKYPEASLDYVWKNLNTFLNQAMKEVYGVANPVAETPKPNPVVKPQAVVRPKDEIPEEILRPDFSLFEEEKTETNRLDEEIKDDRKT